MERGFGGGGGDPKSKANACRQSTLFPFPDTAADMRHDGRAGIVEAVGP